MTFYELEPAFKFCGREIKRLGVEAKRASRYNFIQDHRQNPSDTTNNKHSLVAEVSIVPDTVMVTHTLPPGYICFDCFNQVGFRSEDAINQTPGLNGQLRFVPTKNILVQLLARVRLYR